MLFLGWELLLVFVFLWFLHTIKMGGYEWVSFRDMCRCILLSSGFRTRLAVSSCFQSQSVFSSSSQQSVSIKKEEKKSETIAFSKMLNAGIVHVMLMDFSFLTVFCCYLYLNL